MNVSARTAKNKEVDTTLAISNSAPNEYSTNHPPNSHHHLRYVEVHAPSHPSILDEKYEYLTLSYCTYTKHHLPHLEPLRLESI